MAENETLVMATTWPVESTTNTTSTPTTTLNQTDYETLDDASKPFYLRFRDEPWVIPLVTLSCISIVAILIFEVYVLYKSCGGKRHLFLGQVLLLGLLLSSVLALLYVPEPHWLFCGITRAGVGIAYAIVFGTLLVKCVFLLKLHDGVYFNASYQGLLLFFIVAVEVSIVTQWLVYEPPTVVTIQDVGSSVEVCQDSPVQRIQYLSYVTFLIFLVIIAAIRGRSLRENNKEALYIGVAIGISLVIWVAWISVALIFDRRFEAASEALGLVSISLVVFFLIFVPKAVQLRASHRGFPDSTSGSQTILNTPSFLRLQPHAIMPSGMQGTIIKAGINADYCRGYPPKYWHYDCSSFHKSEPRALTTNEYNSLKKPSASHSYFY